MILHPVPFISFLVYLANIISNHNSALATRKDIMNVRIMRRAQRDVFAAAAGIVPGFVNFAPVIRDMSCRSCPASCQTLKKLDPLTLLPGGPLLPRNTQSLCNPRIAQHLSPLRLKRAKSIHSIDPKP